VEYRRPDGRCLYLTSPANCVKHNEPTPDKQQAFSFYARPAAVVSALKLPRLPRRRGYGPARVVVKSRKLIELLPRLMTGQELEQTLLNRQSNLRFELGV
jgi:hypothetical protein